MTDYDGEHHDRDLESGDSVYLVKPPNGKWRIEQYGWSGSTGPPA